MKIYIDLLIILNFFYDFLLMITVSLTLKRNAKIKRILLSSIISSLSTLIIFIPINKYIIFLLKIIVSLLMIIISFSYKNIKYFIENVIYLYMSSVILAGFLYFLKIQFNNMCYAISIIIAPLILFVYIKEQKKLKEKINYNREVTINFKNNKSITIIGFIDSGNKLKDPITNKYIIIINRNIIKGIYNIRSPMYVPINTVNGSSIMPCIGIKNIVIDNIIYNNYLLGISENLLNNNIECLLNYHLLEENNV